MRFLALLLDITKDDVFNAYAKTRYVTPAWSALTYSSYYCHCSGEGLTHLTVGIFTGTNAEFFSNMSSPMAKQTSVTTHTP